jgi:uncharacterized repeat protein (TIGR01451 family)
MSHFSHIAPIRYWPRHLPNLFMIVLLAALVVSGLGMFMVQARAAKAAGLLTVSIVAAPNLVVDSNVLSPSTYAPSVATVMGKFCNTGDAALTDVYGYIGDGTTPGTYPTRDCNAGQCAQHPLLIGTGVYNLTHLGGSAGAADATRFIGTLPAGACKVQYWHFTYPQVSHPYSPGQGLGNPVWGATNDPNDDLWLNFVIWGSSSANSASATHKVTMRNEISAMANKIWPNGGQWFNTEGNIVKAGDLITSNGINYDINVVNQGFDNDGNFTPDYNAWLQPVGDPLYNPTCFRLVRTTGVLTISRSAMTDLIQPFVNQLYFTYIPTNNNGVLGNVHYTFMAVNGPCQAGMSPYQEVASGSNNEKFNGDYGIALPRISSTPPDAALSKNSTPFAVNPGDTIFYTMHYTNTGTTPLGRPEFGMPLVLSDTIRPGTTYQAGSAALTLGYTPGGAPGYSILFSTNNGLTWSTTEPAPASVTTIQWWLTDAMPSGPTGWARATHRVTVNNPYTQPSPLITNWAGLGFGNAAPFLKDPAVNMVQGNNSIGDFVWRDLDNDGIQDGGAETGIANVTVRLFLDVNGDGKLDSGDILAYATSSDGSGIYGFGNLANNTKWLVQVDHTDPDIPTGYAATTPKIVPVTITGPGQSVLTADFGFGPIFQLNKIQITPNPIGTGDLVSYRLILKNLLPGNGTGQPAGCQYDAWSTTDDYAGHATAANRQWVNPAGAFDGNGPNLSTYSTSAFVNVDDRLIGTAQSLGSQAGNIVKVEMIFSFYMSGALSNDYATARLYYRNDSETGVGYDNTVDFPVATLNQYVGQANQGLLIWDVTNTSTWRAPNTNHVWSYADFLPSENLDTMIVAQKVSGADGITLHVDAQGFRVTTDQLCGGPDNTIVTLPVTDTYDQTYLGYVASSPAASTVVTPTITWNNMGPLYGGQTKTIDVTFRARAPIAAPGTTNTAQNGVNSFLADGTRVNQSTGSVQTPILPAAGDTIYWDTNGNGQQDAGEAGILGAHVQLCSGNCTGGGVLANAYTTSSGYYLFSRLSPATYRVQADTGAGQILNNLTQTGDPDTFPAACAGAACDNLADRAVAGADILTLDFGYRSTTRALITGNVWQDFNASGTHNYGETNFAGVTVRLCTTPACTTVVATTTTDANGNYFFQVTAAGSYTIDVQTGTLPAGTTWTQTGDPDQPGIRCTTCDNQRTLAVTLGNYYPNNDFGYQATGAFSIGDFVWRDWDGDGLQDTGEEGISGATVKLYRDLNNDGVLDLADPLVNTQVTNAGGVYTFSNLAAGNYLVVVDALPTDYTYRQTGDPDQPGGMCTRCDSLGRVTLGPSTTAIDFGYKPQGAGSIGDFVWRDLDRDGVQDGGAETGIAGITVNLYEDTNGNGVIDAGDALVATTSTDAAGAYSFASLPAARYLVQVDTLDPQLPVDGNSNRYVLSTSNSPLLVTLAAGQNYTTADFGFTPGGLIGDRVWRDNNQDGLQGQYEPGINGLTVTLYNDVNGNGVYDAGTDTLYGTTTTATVGTCGELCQGIYEFKGLPAGNYVVVVSPPGGGAQSYDPDAACPGAACNNQTGVLLQPGQVDRTNDFGYYTPGVIGDTLWIDNDNDGIQDAGESGIAGVTLTLTGPGCAPCTTTTDSSGYYAFGGLAGGTYTVAVNAGTLPAGLSQTYDPDQPGSHPCTTCDNQTTVALPGGGAIFTADFGYRYAGAFSISGFTFFDAGNDGGIYTSGTDTPWNNITVYLWRQDGNGNWSQIASTPTLADGSYTFPGLPNGAYAVSVDPNDPRFTGMSRNTPTPNNYYEPVTISGASITHQDFGWYGDVDFGDLPSIYNASKLGNDGARHFRGSLWLGTGSSAEGDTRGESANADADTLDDGVVRTPNVGWLPGGSGSIDVTANGAGYLAAWIDWNNDGDFLDAGERVLVDRAVGAGTQTITFPIPGSVTVPNTFSARLRLYAASTAGLASPFGAAVNGEVEDYRWAFGPTAITLGDAAVTAGRSVPVALLALLGATLLAGVALAWRRKQTL